jgi:hypothetical protein
MKKRLMTIGASSGMLGYVVGFLLLGELAKSFMSVGTPQLYFHVAASLSGNVVFAIALTMLGRRYRLTSVPKAFGASMLVGFVIFSGMDLLFFPIVQTAPSTLLMISGHFLNCVLIALLGGLAGLQLSFLKDPIVRHMVMEH